jgi:DNA-binding GntR family transcriptional regulator
MADQVAEMLRDRILTGKLEPGARVTHEDLAQQLGVSTMPVREALIRLSYEGFIDTSPNRSYRVASMTREDIHDIYWINGVLVGELTARACLRASPELIDQLRDIQAEWSSGTHLSPAELEALGYKWARLINDAAGSARLDAVFSSYRRFIPEHFYTLLPAWSDASVRNHAAILDAIERHDSESARKAAESGVKHACDMLMEYFDDRGYFTEPSAEPAERSRLAKVRSVGRRAGG